MRLIPVWVSLLMLSSCGYDPVNNPGTWKIQPTGLNSNDENLRAMVVSPRDLVVGRGESTSEGVTAARAARHELTGNRAPLPEAGISLSSQGGGGQQGQPGQQPGAGGGGSAAPTE